MRLNFQLYWPTKNHASGFTLIELSVGLTLWILVTVILTRVFQSGLKSWKHAADKPPLYQEARVVLDQISREFRNSIDVPGIAWSASGQEVSFATFHDTKIEKISYQI